MKISEIIVVEGKNDTNVLKSCLDCDTIETHGTNLNDETLDFIKQAQATRGVIIFTDPDSPGEKIRSIINERIKGCKNAFIEKSKAKTTKKVGVEHASKKDILEALSHLMTFQEGIETITHDEFIALGLSGQKNSAALREYLGKQLFIGKPNAKTLFKRLNMLHMKKSELEKYLKEIS